MTDNDSGSGTDFGSEEATVETTSVFRADFLNELDAPASTSGTSAVSGVEGLPVGSALLVVKRGPNAGSRFLLDQPGTRCDQLEGVDHAAASSSSISSGVFSGSGSSTSSRTSSRAGTAAVAAGARLGSVQMPSALR